MVEMNEGQESRFVRTASVMKINSKGVSFAVTQKTFIEFIKVSSVHRCQVRKTDTYMVVLVPVTGMASTRSAQITLRSPGIE